MPLLRQLFPYTSHATLCFSTCTGYPYSAEIPCIEPSEDGYVLRTLAGQVIGRAANAQIAIELLLAHVPAQTGPAVAGTAAAT